MKQLTNQYLKLVEEVRKIDVQAAEYMLNEVPKLSFFNVNASGISGIFDWERTPQGTQFWAKIGRQTDQHRYKGD